MDVTDKSLVQIEIWTIKGEIVSDDAYFLSASSSI